MRARSTVGLAFALTTAILLVAPSAFADKVALLPSRGGTDAAARAALDGDLSRGLGALGHTVVFIDEAAARAAGVLDGLADTADEYRAITLASRSDWVVAGSVEPAVRSARVELTAYFAQLGRLESLAREVNQDKSGPEVTEMLSVLLRPEGIGVAALPWEQQPPPPPPPPQPPPPQPPPSSPFTAPWQPPPPPQPKAPPADDHHVWMNYLSQAEQVWPAYSAGKRLAVAASLGFAALVARPDSAGTGGASLVGSLRAAYAAGDRGLEPFLEFGGNLAGPRALWLDIGARWMWNPTLGRRDDGALRASPLFLGPELLGGLFVRLGGRELTAPDGTVYSSSAGASPMLGAAFSVVYAISPTFQLEAQPFTLRWVPVTDGSLVFLGATLGGALRF